MSGQKNAMIQVWRVVFAFLIFACHTGLLPWWTMEETLLRSASLGVEFFFILSGFLMLRSAERRPVCTPREEIGPETLRFLGKKWKAIFPVFLFAFVLEIIVSNVLPHSGSTGLMNYVYRIWDLLFLRAVGLQGDSMTTAVGASWYVMAMFTAMFILYPLLLRNRNTYKCILAPLTAVFILGWFSNVHGSTKFQLDFSHGTCLGVLRALAELCAGALAYMLAERLSRLADQPQDEKNGRNTVIYIFATVTELACFGGAIWIMRRYLRSQTDFLCILLLTIGVAVCFSGLSYTRLLSRKFRLDWAGDFSLALYLNHSIWLRMFQRWPLAIPFMTQVLICLGLSILSSLACIYTIRVCRSLWAARCGTK